MKQYINSVFTIVLFFFSISEMSAQTIGQNYIVTTVPTAPVTYPTNLTIANANSTIQYFDGLGRTIETVQKAQSLINSTWVDLVNFTEYDSFGRDYKHWLPAPATGSMGAYVSASDFASQAYTEYKSTEKPYATTEFEPSPLNRTTGQYGAGTSWYTDSKKQKTDYGTNAGEVTYFYVNSSNQLVCGNGNTNYYDANMLYKTVVADEDGKTTTEYKDKQGRMVLKRGAEGGNIDTYYVYNDLGQLSFILSPKASDDLASISLPLSATNDNSLGTLGYAYQYDTHGNCIWKKLPGCEPIYMLYDKADRMVLSQDGNQRTASEWTFTKYDALGRVIQTGKATNTVANSTDLTTLRDKYSADLIVETYTTGSGYTSTKLMGTSPVILTQNYYDTYDYLSIPAYVSTNYNLGYKDFSLSGFDIQYTSAKGLLTGTVTAMLDNSLNLVTAMYYDDHGRVVQTRATNHLNGYDYEFFHYSFTGQVLNKQHIHKALTNAEITENYRFTYDHANRLTGEYHTLNTQPEATLATMTYDELGRINQKILHGGIQTITYTYNIRNWLKSISSPQFTETLYYQDSPYYCTPCYNGNISVQFYGTTTDKMYTFSYDGLNRLKLTSNTSDPIFAENVDSYDKNGNILRIKRNGYVWDELYYTHWNYKVSNGTIDDLTLAYNGNQLKSVSDAVYQDLVIANNDFVDKHDAAYPTEYLYDANGNQTADLNKGVAWIRYNILNLPQKVQFRNRTTNEYIYDASGVKHTAKYNYSTSTSLIPLGGTTQENTLASTFQTDYCGNYVYEKSGATGEKLLKRILTPEGYVETTGRISSIGNWTYTYPLKDHLGNTRVKLTSYYLSSNTNKTYSASGQIDYYPFGMERSNGGTFSSGGPLPIYNSESIQYMFNGKEIDRLNGLNEYDFGARWDDPAVGGCTTMDPLSEKKPWISPYSFCSGNPVNRIDQDGKDDIFSISGSFVKSTPNGSRVLIQNGNNFYVLSKLYQLQPDQNAADRASMRITIHYADQKGYKGTFGVSSNIASVFGYTTPDKKVYLSVESIKNGDFNNYFNIYSTLFHEADPDEGHKSETIPYKYYKYKDHLNVLAAQIDNDDFYKCDEDFKMRTVALYGNYLLKAWQNNEISEKERDKMEEDFNAIHDYEMEIKSTQTNVTHNGQTQGYQNNVEDPH